MAKAEVKLMEGPKGSTGRRGATGPKWADVDIARLDEKLDAIKEDVSHLTKAIFDGNGQPSVLSRMDRIEQVIEAAGVTSRANADAVAVISGTVQSLTTGMAWAKREIEEHPSINRLIAQYPAKTIGIIASILAGSLTALVALHAIISLPGVSLWIEQMLGLP